VNHQAEPVASGFFSRLLGLTRIKSQTNVRQIAIWAGGFGDRVSFVGYGEASK